MKFTRDDISAVSIRDIEPGAIRIGDELLTGNVVLTHEQLIREWFPADIESLSEQDLERILDLKPEIVIIGTGDSAKRPPNSFVFGLARRGVGLETMDTAAACRTFNILLAEGRRVVALLVLEP